MNKIISEKAKLITTSPLEAFFLKVKNMQNVIELNIGDPENETPEVIKQAAIKAIEDGDTHYVSASGSPELKRAIKTWYEIKGNSVSEEEIVASQGSRIVLNAVLWAIIGCKDKVIIPAPYYPSFVSLVKSHGGVPVILNTEDDNFQLTAQAIEQKITELGKLPKVLILNSPNNPSGAVYSKEELRKIVSLSEKYGFVIISDECYQSFSCDKNFSLRELSDDIIVVDSCSKRFFMTGWRIGWGVIPKGIARAVKAYLGRDISSLCSISEKAAIAALNSNIEVEDFSEQRELMKQWIEKNNLKCAPIDGGFYAFIDFSSAVKTESNHELALANIILFEALVALAPGSSFGEFSSYLRLAYCVEVETLKEALGRIDKVLERY